MTIKEFADAIGVSPTTVSRSISQRGRISDDTRRMVLQRMQELGYTPNMHAQRLVSGRAGTVALHFGTGPSWVSDMFLIGLLRGVQQAVQDKGCGLLLAGHGDGLHHWTKSRAVDGVIAIGGTTHDAEVAQEIVATGVPCVVIGTQPLADIPGTGSVLIDLSSGARQAARALLKEGHRHIGFISSYASNTVLPAFRQELKKAGVPLQEQYVIIVGHTPDDGEQAMRQLLSLAEPPTAVFTRTDELAVGALRAARKAGVAVPAQLSIIGHDDLAFTQFTDPPLSTVRVNCDEVGAAATAMLFALMDQPENPFASLKPRSVQTEMVRRETLAAAAPPAVHANGTHTQKSKKS